MHPVPVRFGGPPSLGATVACTAPARLGGLPLQSCREASRSDELPGRLLLYGRSFGSAVVLEQPGGGDPGGGLWGLLPSVSVSGADGRELVTPLGAVVRFARGGITYTVLGQPAAAGRRGRGAGPVSTAAAAPPAVSAHGAAQDVRRARGRGRRRRHRADRRRVRLPRPERRGQDDVAADDARPDPAHVGRGAPVRPRPRARSGRGPRGRGRVRGGPRLLPVPERARQPRAAGRARRRRRGGHQRRARDRRARRTGARPRARLLARHAPAPRARGRSAAPAAAARAGRAHHRPRPRRDARHARAGAPPGRRGHHGAALEPSDGRGRGAVQPRGDPERTAVSATRASSPTCSPAAEVATVWTRPTPRRHSRSAGRPPASATPTPTATASRSPPTATPLRR